MGERLINLDNVTYVEQDPTCSKGDVEHVVFWLTSGGKLSIPCSLERVKDLLGFNDKGKSDE